MADYQDRMRKLQGLLAKAEGTDNEHEAAAFMAKAHQIMIDMAIDEATVREAMGESTKRDRPIKLDFEYSSSDSNALGKKMLLNAIARASRVRMVNYPMRRGEAKVRFGATNVASQWCSLVGFEGDIERVKILYASLLVQGFRFGSKAHKDGTSDYDYRGRKVGKSKFMTSFLMGFAETIGQRLRELDAAAQVHTNALIVRTEAEVNEAFTEFFPSVRTSHSRIGASNAYRAGERDGHKADIGRPVVGGSTRRMIAG